MNYETKRVNHQWVEKQAQMHKAYSGYYWSATIASLVLLVLLVYALILN